MGSTVKTFCEKQPPHERLVWRLRLLANLSFHRKHIDATARVPVYWDPVNVHAEPRFERVFKDAIHRRDAKLWPHHRKRHHAIRVVVGYEWVLAHCVEDLVALRTAQLTTEHGRRSLHTIHTLT